MLEKILSKISITFMITAVQVSIKSKLYKSKITTLKPREPGNICFIFLFRKKTVEFMNLLGFFYKIVLLNLPYQLLKVIRN